MFTRFCVMLLFLIGICDAGDAQLNNDQQPIVLNAGSFKILPMPSFSAEVGPQCDTNGNLFFNTGFTRRSTVVLRIGVSDGTATVFRPTGEWTDFLAFHITASEKVAILVSGKKGEPYVIEFKESDPSDSTRTTLDAPAGLTAMGIQSFFVLPNDHIFLQGYFDEDAPKEKRGREYLAEFDPSGKPLRISMEKTSDDVLKFVKGRGAKTAAAQAVNGRTYLLEANKVVVISPSGDVEQGMDLRPPEAGYYPYLLYMHKGQLVVAFAHQDDGGNTLGVRYQLLDPTTGEIIRLYKPDPELGQNLVCFSDDGLIFMRAAKDGIRLINAPVR